ncbi:uncharacterized protein LOC120158744 [Hibiscus syriacus]|uniref:uncharacterized protein LOC120158744 n=1 Tax=Hibiscus syriacus TaxID=106335 RepID=UPI0019224F10|nr:uncharacterized protein LOC120158744 [Hibiscus syriacus]
MAVLLLTTIFRKEIQSGQDDLRQVLCSSAPPCCELQEKEVWSKQPVEAKEEDQVYVFVRLEILILLLLDFWMFCYNGMVLNTDLDHLKNFASSLKLEWYFCFCLTLTIVVHI